MEKKTRRSNRPPRHTVMLPYTHPTTKMTHWCEEHFGPRWSAITNRDGKWCCFWGGRENFHHYIWHFTTERDLTFFLLRWG